MALGTVYRVAPLLEHIYPAAQPTEGADTARGGGGIGFARFTSRGVVGHSEAFVYRHADEGRGGFRRQMVDQGGCIMRFIGKTASALLIWVGLSLAGFASPALAADTAADFEGAWDTVVPEVNAQYRLYLHHEGDEITGNFENKQSPQYNGRLKGSVQNGRLTYTYVQPKTNGEGYGWFEIGPGYTISGLTSPGRGLGKQYRWEGKPTPSTLEAHTKKKAEPAQKGVKFILQITGYDAPEGNEKCFLEPGETAAFLGVKDDDPQWKHLQGIGACDGQDFWVYDEGQLEDL